MILLAAVLGWALAAALGLGIALLMRRLELVARADHELRGPLSALGLAVEALGRQPELRRPAAALDAHLDRLRIGLDDLEAARAGRRAAHRPADVRLEEAARAVADAWTPAARSSGAGLTFEWRAGRAAVHADPARVSQALGNVLANAVEHGGEEIAVAGERHGDRVHIVVRDSGARPAAPRRPGRRGRGLAIAARALEGAGGSLEAPASLAALARAGPRRWPALAPRDRRAGRAGEPGNRGAASAGWRSSRPSTEVRLELPAAE